MFFITNENKTLNKVVNKNYEKYIVDTKINKSHFGTKNEISGSYKLDIDPVELEPTQNDYNPLRNEYNTRIVDSMEVSYELKLTGNQTLSISDDTL